MKKLIFTLIVYLLCFGGFTTENLKLTTEGGLAVKMINKTGTTTTKGYLVTAYTNASASNAFYYTPIGAPDILGIVYDDAVTNLGTCWIVISGKADVAYINIVTNGMFARMGATADALESNGIARGEAIPSSPFATDKHFQEIGHVIETMTNLAHRVLTIIHLN